jgi:hypothetical protein
MNKNNDCPDCGKTLSLNARYCECGWRRQEPNKQIPIVTDYGCQYQYKGRRCRLLGTMSHSIRANVMWYCSYHYGSFGDPKSAEEMLDYIEKNYHEIMERRIDWVKKLFPEEYAIPKRIISKKSFKQ